LEIEQITGIISKTDTPEELVEAIKAVAAGKTWFSRSLAPVLRRLWRYNAVSLTRREVEVLQLVSKEMTDKEIAITLSVSPRTVRFHLENIYIKLEATTRTGAVAKAIQRDLI
jgi:DNA-binding NarL/FixJ family response regulator